MSFDLQKKKHTTKKEGWTQVLDWCSATEHTVSWTQLLVPRNNLKKEKKRHKQAHCYLENVTQSDYLPGAG